jgi:hypothetical protein
MSEINDHITEGDYNAACDVLSTEGQALYYRLRDARRERAQALREAREFTRGLRCEGVLKPALAWGNHVARLLAYGNQEPIMKPTAVNFMAEAKRQIRLAASALPGINGSGSYEMDDGYSCCGLADGHAEDREDAAKWALVNLAAARWGD